MLFKAFNVKLSILQFIEIIYDYQISGRSVIELSSTRANNYFGKEIVYFWSSFLEI